MNPPAKGTALLIYGNHALLVEDELKKEQAKIATKVDFDLNLDVFEAGDDPIDEVLRAADTLPMGSERRYVIVKEAQKLTAAEVKKLAGYLEEPAESSSMILTAVGLKPGASLLKAVEKGGRVKEVAKRRDQVPGWIRSRFKERGLQVTGKAIAYLQEALGEDLLAIEGAVEKVSLYHEGEDPVDLDEVLLLVAQTAERSIFELVDRVALGDSDQALKILRRLLQRGEKPTYVLSALARQFRRLLLYHALREEGRQDADIIEYLNLPRKQAWLVTQKYKPQAARFDEDRLRRALSVLVRSELGIKSGAMDESFALELAVASLSRLGSRPRR